jgi:iron complex transport system permease protein
VNRVVPNSWPLAPRTTPAVISVLVAVLFISSTVAVMVGPVSIRPDVVWRVALDHVIPDWLSPTWQPFEASIIWELRLPRVLLAATAGAGLAVVGATLQALLRNPLADPYLLGTSAGAALGAVGVLLFGVSVVGGLSMSAAAFLGALTAIVVVYLLAWQDGRFPTGRLVLSGVAVSYLFSSVTNLLIYRVPSGEQARTAMFWMLGGLGSARWESLGLPVVVVVISTCALFAFARALNAVSLGEEVATTLGIDGDRFRRIGFLVASLSTGVLVAVTGGIGFVGLMVPHFVRLLIGADHRRLLPAAALTGAIFLIWADVLARTIVAPEELPIGIVTAFAGAPFFLWLMRSRGRSRWVS